MELKICDSNFESFEKDDMSVRFVEAAYERYLTSGIDLHVNSSSDDWRSIAASGSDKESVSDFVTKAENWNVETSMTDEKLKRTGVRENGTDCKTLFMPKR